MKYEFFVHYCEVCCWISPNVKILRGFELLRPHLCHQLAFFCPNVVQNCGFCFCPKCQTLCFCPFFIQIEFIHSLLISRFFSPQRDTSLCCSTTGVGVSTSCCQRVYFPACAGTCAPVHKWMARLSWLDGWLHIVMVYLPLDGHPSLLYPPSNCQDRHNLVLQLSLLFFSLLFFFFSFSCSLYGTYFHLCLNLCELG